jgi:hypothetical protein
MYSAKSGIERPHCLGRKAAEEQPLAPPAFDATSASRCSGDKMEASQTQQPSYDPGFFVR